MLHICSLKTRLHREDWTTLTMVRSVLPYLCGYKEDVRKCGAPRDRQTSGREAATRMLITPTHLCSRRRPACDRCCWKGTTRYYRDVDPIGYPRAPALVVGPILKVAGACSVRESAYCSPTRSPRVLRVWSRHVSILQVSSPLRLRSSFLPSFIA